MKRTASDLEALTGQPVLTMTGREFTFYNAEGVSRQLEQQRLRVLYRLLTDGAGMLVATADGLMQRTMPPDVMKSSALVLKMGGQYDLDAIASALVRCGYSRSEQVEGPGQFALRGGILDFFSPGGDEPFRVEFFGDEVDSVSTFDVSTQRRGTGLRRSGDPPGRNARSLYGGARAAKKPL
jgi:transcription-repair coupling factor (superfamily II helicase)